MLVANVFKPERIVLLLLAVIIFKYLLVAVSNWIKININLHCLAESSIISSTFFLEPLDILQFKTYLLRCEASEKMKIPCTDLALITTVRQAIMVIA